uniref:Uncharacterized protein n=1 Tax=Lactuca sativa TaxID=4236 RepID=A0A9R1UZ17_LACSA|nr:hypothetical protein LSAT_V11C700366930 [Lactuca sativa]
MDSNASCLTPPLGPTMSISFNVVDSDYQLPFHIQLRVLLNTSPTPATRYMLAIMYLKLELGYKLEMMTKTNSNSIETFFVILLCTVSLAAARLLYVQIAYLRSLSYTIPKIKVSYIIVEPHLCFYESR